MAFPSGAQTHVWDGGTHNYSADHLVPTIPMFLRITSGGNFRVRINTGSTAVKFGYTLSLMAIGEDSINNYYGSGTSGNMTCSARGTYPDASTMDSGEASTIALPETKYISLFAHCTSLSEGNEQCDVDVDHEGTEYWTRVLTVQIDNQPKTPANLTGVTYTNLQRTSVTLVAQGFSAGDYTDAKVQYHIDGISSTWQDSASFSGLSPNTTYTGYAILYYDGNRHADKQFSCQFTTPANVPRITSWSCTGRGITWLTFSGTVDPGDYSVQYGIAFNGGGADGAASPAKTFTGLNPNTQYSSTLYVMYGNGETISSTAYGTTLSPVPPTLSAVQVKSGTLTTSSVTLEPVGFTQGSYPGAYLQYKIDNKTDWQTGASFTGLTSNTTYTGRCRVVYTDNYANNTVKYVPDTNGRTCSFATLKVAPTITGVSATSVTGTNVTLAATGFNKGDYADSKVQYSLNGSTWQDSASFTGLSKSTTYTGYARVWYNGGTTGSQKTCTFYTYGITISAQSANSSQYSCTLKEYQGRGTIAWSISCTGGYAASRSDVTKSGSGTVSGAGGSMSKALYPGTYKLTYSVSGVANTTYEATFTITNTLSSGVTITPKTVSGTKTQALVSFTSSNLIETFTITLTAKDSSNNTYTNTATVQNTSESDRSKTKSATIQITGLTNGKNYTFSANVKGSVVTTQINAGNAPTVDTYAISVAFSTIRTKRFKQTYTITAGKINGTAQSAPPSVVYTVTSSIGGTLTNYTSANDVTGLTPGSTYTVSFRGNGNVTQNSNTVSMTDISGSKSITMYKAPNPADVKGTFTRYSGTSLTLYGTCTQYCPLNTITKFEFAPTKTTGTCTVASKTTTTTYFTNDDHTAIKSAEVPFTAAFNNGDVVQFTITITDDEDNVVTSTATKPTGKTNKLTLTLVKAKTHSFNIKAVVEKDANNPDTDMVNRIRIIFRKIDDGSAAFNRAAFGVTNYDGQDYAVYYPSSNSIKFLKGVNTASSLSAKKIIFTTATGYKYIASRKAVAEYTNPFQLPHNTETWFKCMDPYNSSNVFEEGSWYQAFAYIDNVFEVDPDTMVMSSKYEDTYTFLNLKTALSFKNLRFTAEATGTTVAVDVAWDQNDAEGVVATAKAYKPDGTLFGTLNTQPDNQTADLVFTGMSKGTWYHLVVTAVDDEGYAGNTSPVGDIETYKLKDTNNLDAISTTTIRFNFSITNGLDKSKEISYLISDEHTAADVVDSYGDTYIEESSTKHYKQDTGFIHNHTYTIFGWVANMKDQNGKLDTLEAIQVTTQQLILEHDHIVETTQHNIITHWQAYAGQPSSRQPYDADPLTGYDIEFVMAGCYATPQPEAGYQTWATTKPLFAMNGLVEDDPEDGIYVNGDDEDFDKKLTAKNPQSANYGELGYYGAYMLTATITDGTNVISQNYLIHTEFPYTFVYTDVGGGPARYKKAIPYVYTNGSWQKAPVFISVEDEDGSGTTEWRLSNGDDFVQSAPDFVTDR